MTIRIDLNWPVRDFNGFPLPPDDQTAGKIVGAMLANQPKEPLKFYPWAQALFLGKPLFIDRADYELLYKLIEDSPVLPVMTKYPILNAMLESKAANTDSIGGNGVIRRVAPTPTTGSPKVEVASGEGSDPLAA